MEKEEKLKMACFILAGVLMILLSMGRPSYSREAANRRRASYIASQAIIKDCVPGTQRNLPTLPDKISFLCFLDIKSGLLENLGPVSIPKPVEEPRPIASNLP